MQDGEREAAWAIVLKWGRVQERDEKLRLWLELVPGLFKRAADMLNSDINDKCRENPILKEASIRWSEGSVLSRLRCKGSSIRCSACNVHVLLAKVSAEHRYCLKRVISAQMSVITATPGSKKFICSCCPRRHCRR